MKTKEKFNNKMEVKKVAEIIEKTLESFGIKSRVVEINNFENDVQFCLEVAMGTNIKKIEKLDSNIALAVASPTGSVTIEAPIPGRYFVGIRIPFGKSDYFKEKMGKDHYKIIRVEKIVEVEKMIDYGIWKKIKFVSGNIFGLLAECLYKIAQFLWK